MPPSLQIDLAPTHKTGLLVANPVMPASGTFSWGIEFARQWGVNALGAVVSKGITMESRQGNRQPRVAQTPSGMLNSIGLQNIGIDKVITEMAPLWEKWDVPVIANIAADTVDEFGEMARMLDGVPGIAALELNISCPNVDSGGLEIGQNIEASARANRCSRAPEAASAGPRSSRSPSASSMTSRTRCTCPSSAAGAFPPARTRSNS